MSKMSLKKKSQKPNKKLQKKFKEIEKIQQKKMKLLPPHT